MPDTRTPPVPSASASSEPGNAQGSDRSSVIGEVEEQARKAYHGGGGAAGGGAPAGRKDPETSGEVPSPDDLASHR